MCTEKGSIRKNTEKDTEIVTARRTGNEGRCVHHLPVASESSVTTASVNTRPTDRLCAIL